MSYYRITGPTAIFTITGFTNGFDGRMLTLINATSYAMTLKHQVTSSAANQINTGGSDAVLAANGVVTLMYNATLTKWMLTGGQGFATSSSGWGLTGNSSTTAGTNFIGTTDNIDLVFKTNGAEEMGITSAGNVGIGTPTPTQGLEVRDGHLLLSNSGTAGELRLAEPSAGGSNYTAFKTAVQAANITYTLPIADGSNGQVMTTNGSGTMSWATPIGFIKYAKKSAVENVANSSTLQDDDHLTQTLGTNETWELYLQLDAKGNSNNMKMAVVIPTGATMSLLAFQTQSNNINEAMTVSGTATTSNYQMNLTTGTGIFISGIITTSGTAGTVKLQWAQLNAQATATTLGTGSYMKLTKFQ